MSKKNYFIYSHADADGGIAAALFSRWFLLTKHSEYFQTKVVDVNHPNVPDWSTFPIEGPCAILDFTLHPQFLTEKFFQKWRNENHGGTKLATKQERVPSIPQCYWLDHHPTGGYFPFINVSNVHAFLPEIKVIWDVSAISTPGLMRTHAQSLEIPQDLLDEYSELIDLAEIIDGALYASPHSAFDFGNKAVQLRTLFSTTHPVINQPALYQKIVRQLVASSNVSALFESDPIYEAIIEFEANHFQSQEFHYLSGSQLVGNVSVTDFRGEKHSQATLNRFLPYVIHPEAQFAIHLLPEQNGFHPLSCGINPWNKPLDGRKHLGHYFSANFGGGGHSFSAGGRISAFQDQSLEKLISYLNSNT